MTLPQLVVEVSFTADPRLPPTWTDISRFVKAASIRRGRQHELDRFEAGEASVIVDNQDQRFNPFNIGGPYYPYVEIDRRLRISASFNDIRYPLFTGYVDTWPQEREGYNNFYGEVTATDAFKVLSLNTVTSSFPIQSADERIHSILDLCDWQTGPSWILDDATYSVLGTGTILGPVADRHITTGQAEMQAADLEDESALAHLQMVNDSENGLMFMGTDGQFYFFGRHTKINPPFTEVQVIFSDDGERDWEMTAASLRKYPYVPGTLKLRYDDTNLWTKIAAQREGGVRQEEIDPQAGPIKYWHRGKKFNVNVTTDNEVGDIATFMLARYNKPKVRAEGLGVDGEYRDAQNDLWPLILQRELGDRIRIEYTPRIPKPEDLVLYRDPNIGYREIAVYYRGLSIDPGSSIQFIQDSFIESIQIDIDCQEDPAWETVFTVSPADVGTFWKLDDPDLSILGTTTRLTY